MSLDERLIEVGVELDRLSARHAGPADRPSQATATRRVALAAAAVMLVATGVGVYAIARSDTNSHPISPQLSSVTQPAPTVSVSSAPSPTTVAVVDGSPLSQTVTNGAAGPDVTRLQQRLADLGFVVGPVDGAFGATTEQAVWAFKKLIGGMSYRELAADPHASEVDEQWWAKMIGPVEIAPRRPEVGRTHIEVYLPSQVLVAFADNKAVLIAHISTGELDDQGQPALWCEAITYDTDDAGQPLAEPVTTDECGNSKSPGGAFTVYRTVAGVVRSALGGMYNPVFFDYGIAIHGADLVPLEPASHGAIRVNKQVADAMASLVHDGDTVYVWGHDGKQPEEYTKQESLPSFTFRNPDSTTSST